MLSDFIVPSLFWAFTSVSGALSVYAAYLAFSIRRGLVVPIFRSRALWMGAFAILIGLALPLANVLTSTIQGTYNFGAFVITYLILAPLVILVVYVWIDRTMSTIIRLDFLRRDLLYWGKVRIAYWAFAALSLALILQGNYATDGNLLFGFTVIFGVLLAYSAAAFLLGASRTTDKTFRSHVKWFGYLVAVLLVTSTSVLVAYNPAVQAFPEIPIAYSLYKMARHLVPATKFSPFLGPDV